MTIETSEGQKWKDKRKAKNQKIKDNKQKENKTKRKSKHHQVEGWFIGPPQHHWLDEDLD